MKCKNVQKCLFVSHSEESTAFHECKFDEDTWNVLWNECTDMYDLEDISKPTYLNSNVKNIKEQCDKYIVENITFLCELPSVVGFESATKAHDRVRNPYYNTEVNCTSVYDINQVAFDISDACIKAMQVTNNSFQLNRKKAKRNINIHIE